MTGIETGDRHESKYYAPLAQVRLSAHCLFRYIGRRCSDTNRSSANAVSRRSDIFSIDGAQDLAAPETRLISAIGGGVMAGWGVLLWMLSTQLFPRDPALAAKLIITSIVTWFVIDSTGSMLAGAPLNAAFNVSFLLVFCVPLWRYR
jgi:hypothetical protein